MGCGSSTPGTSGSGGSGGSTLGTGGSATGGSSTGGSATGGHATGGNGSGGIATGGNGSGGTATGGNGSGGAATGGNGSGGSATGGTGSGGTAAGGAAGSGNRGGNAAGGTAAGGSSGAGGGGGTAGSGSAPVPSKGCGVTNGAKTLTTGGMSVMSGLATSTKLNIKLSDGTTREYIIDIPANYDPTKPYRLVFSWHQAYGSDVGNANGQYPAFNGPNFDAAHYAFFGLKRAATDAGDSAIFVAPEGIGNLPWDYKRDVVLFDDLLALVDANLCIDDSRVFSTGFSFGAMMSYALSITRQTKLRGVVAMAAANYNLPNEPTDTNAAPIAYMGTTGMSDTTCPWGTDTMGGKACNLQHAKDNNCTIPSGNNIPTTTAGSKKYVCYDFAGCKPGYPVKTCTFDGAHTPSSVDDGTSSGDDGLKAFIPPLAWKFMSQF